MAHAIISVTIDGTTYSAVYELKRGMVSVRTDISTKLAPLGNSPPDVIARMLLRELIQSERVRRDATV